MSFRSLFGKAEGLQPLDVANIPRNVIRANQLEVFLQVGTDGAVFGGIFSGKVNVAFAFHLQDEGGPALHGLFGLGHVNDVFALLVTGEGSVVLEVVEAHHIGNAMSLGGTETDTAQDACNKGDESILFGAAGYLTHLDELGGQEKAADVGFGLFPFAIFFTQSFAHALAVGDSVLDTKAMGHFVEAHIAEEGVEVDIVQLVIAHKEVGDRHEDGLKLGLHGVLELQTAGAHGLVDTLVVRQVDGDGLRTSVAVAGIVDDVVDIEVAGRTLHGWFVLRVARQFLLQHGQHANELGQVVAPFLVFNEDEGFVGGLISVEGVIVILNRSDHEVKLAFLHLHPCHIAVEIVVGHEGFAAFNQIVLQTGVFCQFDGDAEEAVSLGQAVGIFHMVRHHLEGAVLVATDDGVLAALLGVGQCVILFGSHVQGVEVASGRTFAIARDERFLLTKTVPCAILYHGELLHGRVADSVEAGTIFIAEILVPVQIVHDVGNLNKDRKQLLLFLGKDTQIGGQSELGILVNFLLKFGFFFRFVVLASHRCKH